MVKALWKNTVLAESSDTVLVEGNHYFPLEGVRVEYLVESSYRTTCPWKGEAHYYHLVVNGEKNENAAWSYPEPKQKASKIAGHVAYWKGVEIAT